MFSRKSDDKKKKNRPRDSSRLAQFGLLGVEDMDGLSIKDGGVGGNDDSMLEQELLALMEDGEGNTTMSPTARNRDGVPAVAVALDKMVAECMKDDDDVDVTSEDEDDPALLDELMGLSEPEPPAPRPVPNRPVIQTPAPAAAGVSVLHLLDARISNYERAEAQATIDNETSRARRFGRGLKTLQQMKKQVLAGKAIKEEDIPPEVLIKSAAPSPQSPDSGVSSPDTTQPAAPQSVPESAPVPSITEPTPPTSGGSQTSRESTNSVPHSVAFSTSDAETVSKLRQLQSQYKMAALEAKQRGDAETAVSHLRTMKQIQPLVDAAASGQNIDMASLPPPPGTASKQANTMQTAPSQPNPVGSPASSGASKVEDTSNVAAMLDSESLPTVPAGSVLGALEQRMAVYSQQLEKAKADGNSRKERMNQRIMKQYQDAIKKHKLGKAVDYEDLPTPPGFPPLPFANASTQSADAGPVAPKPPSTDGPTPAKVPAVAPQPPPVAPKPSAAGVPKQNVRAAPKSRVERQMSLLQKRQEQFKVAALEAKKRGEIEQAKEYLRNSKGLNHLIEASAAGLPVDMNTVPIPPQESAAGGPTLTRETTVDLAFEVINSEDCDVPSDGTPSDIAIIYTKLEEDLIQQIKMCATTREHFKAVGDVASSNRFEQLIVHTKKDLDAVRLAFKRGDRPPRCHYENRSFSIVQCNTDLNDSDCQVTVVRGINYNVQNPKEVDTYVIIEFPYPPDNPPQDRSEIVKDTNNPVYEHKTIFSIDRKTRLLARVFKRHCIKILVYAKSGWFHRSTLIGQVRIPLVGLENSCTIHDSYDLLDERKKMLGGKLEVKLRVRNPILNKQIEQVNEKWLVIDGF